ncbi:MAG: ABC transporter substrate-binding protein [Proteobacteria bacterium]|nr:ABC transporter substrate-binding protein [Pseudomonadota bacterium]
MKKIIFVIFFLLTHVNLYANEIRISDFRGKEIVLKKPVERVVCLIESALSGIFMLGAQDKIVGISTNVYTGNVFNFYSLLDGRIKSKKIPAPGNWDFANIESIIALKPDIVIIWSEQKDVIDILEKHNIPVYGVFIRKIDDVYKEIIDFGKIFGKEKKAEGLVRFSKEEIKKIENMTKDIKNKKRVYFMWAQSIFNTSCGDSIVNEIIEIAGGINVCKDIYKEHIVVNAEKLREWNPDAIIMWFNEKKDPEDILKEPLLQGINAIKDKKVYEYENIFHYDMWTLKYVYATRAISHYLYPDKFTYDLKRELKRLMKYFYNKEL